MTGRRFPLLMTVLVFLLGCDGLTAKTWPPLSDRQLIESSDLIVVGKVVWIENGEVSATSTDTASILVQEVLKGDGSSIMVPLAFPGKNRGHRTKAGRVESTRTREDIFFDIDQEGVWFLRRHRKGDAFVIDHPARFKPLFFLERIRQSVAAHR